MSQHAFAEPLEVQATKKHTPASIAVAAGIFALVAFGVTREFPQPTEANLGAMIDKSTGAFTWIPELDNGKAISGRGTLVIKTDDYVNKSAFDRNGKVGTLKTANFITMHGMISQKGELSISYNSSSGESCNRGKTIILGDGRLDGTSLAIPALKLDKIEGDNGCQGGWTLTGAKPVTTTRFEPRMTGP